MEKAIDTLIYKLILTGMTRPEALSLLAQFLEEEAFDYVDCMRLVQTEDGHENPFVIKYVS